MTGASNQLISVHPEELQFQCMTLCIISLFDSIFCFFFFMIMMAVNIDELGNLVYSRYAASACVCER